MYSQEQMEKLLALHTKLVRGGLDPDYAELRVLRLASGIDDVSVKDTATEIIDGTEERWKQKPDSGDDSGHSFYDELRRRLEAERASKAGPSAAARKKLERLP